MTNGGADAPGAGGGAGRSQRNYARLRVAVGPLVGPAVCRVVSGVAAHVDCPTDRLDDALLICDAIAAHAPSHIGGRYVSLTIDAGDEALRLRVGPLLPDGARGLISDSQLPGVGNVLEQIASGLRVERAADGSETLLIDIDFVPAGARR